MAVSVGQEDDVMSTINITPFTDVLLVLLIIFIILAAVTKEPKLPDAKNRERVVASQIVVIINDKSEIQIGSNENVAVRDAKDAFVALQTQTNHAFHSVIIKASPAAQFGVIEQVMDAAQGAGLIDFGLANHVEGTPENTGS